MPMKLWRVWDKTGKHVTREDIEAEDMLHAKIEACKKWDEQWTVYGKNCRAEPMKVVGVQSGERHVLSVREVRR